MKMHPIIKEIGYTDEGFEVWIECEMPDGTIWHSKSINTTEEPISLYYLEMLVENCKMIVARKAAEFIQID